MGDPRGATCEDARRAQELLAKRLRRGAAVVVADNERFADDEVDPDRSPCGEGCPNRVGVLRPLERFAF